MAGALLIRSATLLDGQFSDARVEGGRVTALGRGLPTSGARIIEAAGGLLIPGLHDHHVHVAATAAARASVRCGPPDVVDPAGLAQRLSAAGSGWLRGVGYHESVAGMLDRAWLDAVAPDRPLRIQHRSGRMWFLNTLALDTLLSAGISSPEGLDRLTGRVFDADDWMRRALESRPPAFDAVGAEWARLGVTGVTEMSPANGADMAAHFATERQRGALPQQVVLAGRPELGAQGLAGSLILGPVKLHLHEAEMPDFGKTVDLVREAHVVGRNVAVHCVSEVELVFTLAALRTAGVERGDRIEHASVCPDPLLDDIVDLGLSIVAQPNFVSERGDAYRAAIPSEQWPWLYRLKSVIAAGAPLAGGTDVPFGDADPWCAMDGAVSRRTPSGAVLGAEEALTPEQALGLFLADPLDLGVQRRLEAGMAADLCLLTAPWAKARGSLSADLVRATLIDGEVVHDRVDQTPTQGGRRADSFA